MEKEISKVVTKLIHYFIQTSNRATG